MQLMYQLDAIIDTNKDVKVIATNSLYSICEKDILLFVSLWNIFPNAIFLFQTNNIFSSLSAESFSAVMKVLKHSILATDLSTYFE